MSAVADWYIGIAERAGLDPCADDSLDIVSRAQETVEKVEHSGMSLSLFTAMVVIQTRYTVTAHVVAQARRTCRQGSAEWS